jgi:hypothetical protein
MVGLGGIGLVGGIVGGRRVYATSQLRSQMMTRAAKIISEKEQAEIEQLPTQARTQIREYFHGVCLDSYRFAEAVCAPCFRDRLAGCCDDVQRQREFHLAFSKHLATQEELNNRLRTSATDVGCRLDRNWADCCHDVAETWGVALRPYEAIFPSDQLALWAEPLVRERLQTAIEETTTATLRPAIATLLDSLGTSAVLLLPVMVESPFCGVPLFAALAFEPVFEFLIGLFRSRQADVQHRVTKQVAVLSARIGSEFEREVRRRIAQLHSWQYGALRDVAQEQAQRTIGWL